jgi:N-acetylglucosaminyldiphosphoundecaprenol N-acetyl-beta-D-mannosaminyltransferase
MVEVHMVEREGTNMAMPLTRRKFMNTYIEDISHTQLMEHLEACICDNVVCHVVPLNTDQVVRVEWDGYFKEVVDNTEVRVVDGTPLMWIAKLYGKPFKEKICGSDLVPQLCEMAARKGYSVFFLGAAKGVAEVAARNMQHKYSNLKIAGTYSPAVGFEKDQVQIDAINAVLRESDADIVFVGMGVPKQDIFIYENKSKYRIPVSISVGGTIDFLAGVQKRAPKWMNRLGMEWFYRFVHDPKRLFKRYFVDDMRIMMLAWKYRKNEKENISA